MEEPMLTRTTLTTSATLTKTIQPIYPVLPLVNEIYGTAGDDYLYGTTGDDNIYGLAGNDTLYGLAGNDVLDGGAGVDVMAGGTGNDVYIVDNLNDVVWEWGGEGIDTVRATLNHYDVYRLPVAVENIVLNGFGPSGAWGNELDNVMLGNEAENVFEGESGNDTLKGAGGDDRLYSGYGNDVLDGGTGADSMQGGPGDDLYYVDNPGDTIYESINSGIDTVHSKVGSFTIPFVLPDNVEHLVLEGFATYAVGNSLDNTLRGNSTGNTLIGGGGFDTMYGAEGADTFKYTSMDEAAATSSGLASDYIADFSSAEGDKIDLSIIDANLLAAGDQAFRFIGNNNNYVAGFGPGQLRFNNGFVEGDVDGDLVSDFAIKVNATALPDDAFIL
jgi:Ca2+-binding RTX toxin-like protein